jgi:hypothetical protein
MPARPLIRFAAVAGFLLMANAAQAQGITVPGLRLFMGHPVSPVVLAGIEPVQKELALKTEQIEKAKSLMLEHRQEFISEFQSAGFDFQGLQNLSDDERQKEFAKFQEKMGEIGKSLHEKFQPKLAEFLDEAQKTRLAELAHQAAGAQDLANAEVVKLLEITKEQQEKLASISKEFRAKVVKSFGEANRDTRTEQLRQAGTDWDAQAIEVLNKDQKVKFAKLKGKPFDFAEVRLGGD